MTSETHTTTVEMVACGDHGEADDSCANAEVCQKNPETTWRGTCSCGWSQPKPTVSRGAAGFSASAHAKKALGQPVFAKKPAPTVPAVVPDGLMSWVLPATGVRIPDGRYEITNRKEFRGRYHGEGPGWEAKLRRDHKPVADVVYHGDGGEVQVEWLDADPRKGPSYVTSQELQLFKAWVETFTGMWVPEDDSRIPGGLPWSVVGVLDVLETEARVRTMLDRAQTIQYRLPEFSDAEFGHVSNSSGARRAGALTWLQSKHSDALVWSKDRTAWLPVAEARKVAA